MRAHKIVQGEHLGKARRSGEEVILYNAGGCSQRRRIVRRYVIAGAVATLVVTPVSAINLRPSISLPRPPSPVRSTAVNGSLGTAGSSGAGHIEKLPGRLKWQNITVKQGVAKNKSFSDWSTGATGSGGTSPVLKGGSSSARCRGC
jgi:hypothetical protein